MKLFNYTVLALVIGFSSCNNDDEIPEMMTTAIQFENTLNGKDLVLNSSTFTLPSGEAFTPKKFKYYISNVALINSKTGIEYLEPDSYHLINSETNIGIDLGMIPSSNYDQIRFSIGVDAEANAKTDQTGDLDPNSDMAWSWNSGYKFVLLEGEFVHAQTKERTGLVLHIGRNQNYKTITQPISGIQAGKPAIITLTTKVDELFLNPNALKVSELPSTTIMGGELADRIGENYAEGFVSIK
ncbi:MbnP family protein [Algoriphagus marinus]|uniref:MbnP family protein n=1 Tax=Algoriphagus marinus TaxID=1925762 RepID=UPI00094BA7F5|nr:MbnP family protein [Algoriphagus marinus]